MEGRDRRRDYGAEERRRDYPPDERRYDHHHHHDSSYRRPEDERYHRRDNERRSGRTPSPSREQYERRRERRDRGDRRRSRSRSRSPAWSERRQDRDRENRSTRKRQRSSRSSSRDVEHRRRRRSSRGRRDSYSQRDSRRREGGDERYYQNDYADRESERRDSNYRRRRQMRRREASDERSYSSRSSEHGGPPLHPPNEALPRAGVVSDDEEHNDTSAPADGGGAQHSTAVAKLPKRRREESHPAAERDDATEEDNNNNQQRSPSHHDDSVGHFRGGRGTLIADRYRVLRDVGFGTFGRVVECLDLENERRDRDRRHRRSGSWSRRQSDNNKYVAIKVVRNVKRYYDSAQIEARIVQDVNRRGGRGITHCAILHEAFTFSGHFCMVFENLGLSLYDFLKRHKYQPFPMACIQDFAVQLLQTLEFLHSFRLIHTDLKIENILLTNDREVTYNVGGHHDRSQSQRVPESTHIKVIDFGGACYDDAKKSAVINTRQYRAPEVMLGTGWSMPSDCWSLGCILAELYQGELLFPTHNNAEHLALMERTIGPFPYSILGQARNASELARECFGSDGRHRMERVLSAESAAFVKKSPSLESIVCKREDEWFLNLLRRLLVIDPEARATAHECLRYLSTIRRDVVRYA